VLKQIPCGRSLEFTDGRNVQVMFDGEEFEGLFLNQLGENQVRK